MQRDRRLSSEIPDYRARGLTTFGIPLLHIDTVQLVGEQTLWMCKTGNQQQSKIIYRNQQNEEHHGDPILHSFASAGKSVTPPTDHGSMSRLMFGLTKATRPPLKMRQRMRQKCVCCVAKGAPPSQFVMSVRSTIVLNVLTPTLVGPRLFVKYNTNDSWSC